MIPMPLSFEKLSFLTGSEEILRAMPEVPALPLFSESVESFLAALSRALLADPRTKTYPDLTDYAFWVRGASLRKMRERYPQRSRKLGRGVSFHVAPSNVPMAFALSLTAGLLAGNACIVRLSERVFPQADLLIEALDRLLDGGSSPVRPYLCIIRYPHDEETTAALTSLCDVRMIWGGDQTIEAVRRAPLPPRAIELAFTDRYSVAVIDADAYLQLDPRKVAEQFYLDTYYIDQNACSSPRLVFWLGREVERAQACFWDTLSSMVRERYELKPIQVIDKYTAFCEAAALGGARLQTKDNHVIRAALDRLDPAVMAHKEGSGFFFEYRAQALEELLPLLQKPCQTISCLGIGPEEIRAMVLRSGVRGGDRVVPVGQTNKLTLLWDGYDLCETMSRYVNIGTEE